MRTAVIIQARMTSKRLPGKVLLPLAGKPVIQHVIERASEIGGIHDLIVAVPDTPEQEPLVQCIAALGVQHVAGPEDDVLGRYLIAAEAASADIVVRITADCPLINPLICGQVIELLGQRCDYASNVMPRGYPKGLDCEAFTMPLLRRANDEAKTACDREHVTPWMQNAERVKRRNLGGYCPMGNFCIDTPEDYERLKALFDHGEFNPADWRLALEIAA